MRTNRCHRHRRTRTTSLTPNELGTIQQAIAAGMAAKTKLEAMNMGHICDLIEGSVARAVAKGGERYPQDVVHLVFVQVCEFLFTQALCATQDVLAATSESDRSGTFDERVLRLTMAYASVSDKGG